MNTAQPIRNDEDLLRFLEYYRAVSPNSRNYLLTTMGLNTALRISDLLTLRWGDVYDFEQDRLKKHLSLTEQKTGKRAMILLNRNIEKALRLYQRELYGQARQMEAGDWLFENQREPGKPISRIQAFRIVRNAARACHLEGVISCHSMRKTFGYHAWRQGVDPVMLMSLFNHSSFRVTLRYLGVEQEDRDRVYRDIYR